MKNILFVLVLVVSACSGQGQEFSGRERGAIGGMAAGTGIGAIIGHATNRVNEGMAIGAGVGLLGGALLGNEFDNVNNRNREQEYRIRQQEEELWRQRREIEELKRRLGR